MAKCRRPLPAESQRILQAMTRDLRDRLSAFGWTHSALAERLRCDRTRISHALTPSGEELPPRQLIQSIADVLDARAAEQGPPLPPRPDGLCGVGMRPPGPAPAPGSGNAKSAAVPPPNRLRARPLHRWRPIRICSAR